MTEKNETPTVDKTEKNLKASQGVLFDQLVAMEKGTEVKKRRGRPSKSKTEENSETETKVRKKTTSKSSTAKSTSSKGTTGKTVTRSKKIVKTESAEEVKKTPAKRGRKSKAEKEAEALKKTATIKPAAIKPTGKIKPKASSDGADTKAVEVSIFANKRTDHQLAESDDSSDKKRDILSKVKPVQRVNKVKNETRVAPKLIKRSVNSASASSSSSASAEPAEETSKNNTVFRSSQKFSGKSSTPRNNNKDSNTKSFSSKNKNRTEQDRSEQSRNDKIRNAANRNAANRSTTNRNATNRNSTNRNDKNKHIKKVFKQHEQPLPDDNKEFENLVKLKVLAHEELFEIAKSLEVKLPRRQKRKELIISILEAEAKKSGRHFSGGILEVLAEGYGFLRAQSYLLDHNDIYVSPSQIRKFRLRTGDTVMGHIRTPREGEGYNALLRVDSVNFEAADVTFKRNTFENLTPIYPNEKFNLETKPHDLSCRVIDLIAPIGKGQRGLIVAPPKAGKTTLIKEIANSVMENYPEVELMVLLIDERPEEVTDMERSIKGEVISSTFDKPISNHIQVTEMVIEKAKRYVEQGKDVIILLDSLTRLARAYNIHVPSSGQTLTGGVNPLALYKPKKFFGSARNIEEGGSLTIIGTILVDTGSRMDEVIFEEFKGTGNMELILDRNLFQKRIFPAVNVKKSSTRREDLLIDPENLEKVWSLRKIFGNCTTEQSISLLLTRLKKTANNGTFLRSINIDKINSDDAS